MQFVNRIPSGVLVTLQFSTAAALVLSSFGRLPEHPWALGTTILGAFLGCWAWAAFGWRKIRVMPELRKDASLVTGGPYHWIRHPMYTAVLLFSAGFVAAPLGAWKLGVWLVLWAVVAEKARREERLLRQRFPAYADYRRGTGRFLPKWGGNRSL